MTRRSFRSAVEGPRPLGALVMVAAASATLDVTGQMRPWALACQALALAWALRRRAVALQRSRALLNGLLALVVAVAAGLWLRGTPPIVALAHFASLAQGLQLLDARPRKSEFLLVALALFQVILASNLTDSVLFPPLLVVFLLASVWTLLLHTLEVEALEAGDPLAASRVATPGLLRTTLVASTLSILLALVFFVVLPRMRPGALRGGGLGLALAVSGFSDQLELGDLGRIRMDPRTVLRVETLAGPAPAEGEGYWRGLAFDRFDGRRWSVTAGDRRSLVGSPEFGLDLGSGRAPAELVQRIAREPVAAGVLFAHGWPRRLSGSIARVERDRNGGLYAPAQEEQRVSYTIATRRAEDAPLADPERYLQLPELAPWVGELAARITTGAPDDAERAARLERYLRENGRYSDTPPELDAVEAPVEAFLAKGLAGHCEYFASAMVVLARASGLPARLVNGFAGGRVNRIGGFVTLSRADAHAWVEVHLPERGWVRFDPTPPDLRRAAAGTGLRARAGELASALELWWFQRVVDFDRTDQARALRAGWLAWRRWSSAPRETPARPAAPQAWRIVDPRAVAVAAGLLAALLAAARLRGRRRRRLPAAYARALRILARRGLVRGPAVPARGFAALVAERLPAAGRAFSALTEAYLAERFGGRPAAGAEAALRALRDSLRA